MNLITSIALSFLFLIQGLGFTIDLCCELPKIPNLLEHYEEHNVAFGDSFIDFLEEDYFTFDGSQKHHEDSDHDDLPFQGSHHCCAHSPIFQLLETEYLVSLDVVDVKPEYSQYRSALFSEFIDSPFQPPQA